MEERRIYQNETVFLPDLARKVPDPSRPGPIITATFQNCVIRGPAIVVLLSGVEMDGVAFGIANNDIESILWEVPDQVVKVGAIGFQDCQVLGGRTEGVGFAGPREQLDTIRRAISGT